MWAQPASAEHSSWRDEVDFACSPNASAQVQSHLVKLVHSIPIAGCREDRQHAVQRMLPQAASGESIRKVQIDFFTRTAHLVWRNGEALQLLHGHSRGNIRQESNMKPGWIDAALLQKRVAFDDL